MGAQSFIHIIEAKSASEGFNALVEEANYEYGQASYNGSINTCEMGRCKKTFDKYLESNKKKAYQFVEDNDLGSKWTADYLDLGVKHYKVYTFKKVVEKSTPTYKLAYVVKEGMFEIKTLKNFDTKTKADDYAVELSMKNPNKSYEVHKEYVLTKGKSVVTKIEKEVKIYKSKPNLKPMKNRIVVPIHEYMFYGWASC